MADSTDKVAVEFDVETGSAVKNVDALTKATANAAEEAEKLAEKLNAAKDSGDANALLEIAEAAEALSRSALDAAAAAESANANLSDLSGTSADAGESAGAAAENVAALTDAQSALAGAAGDASQAMSGAADANREASDAISGMASASADAAQEMSKNFREQERDAIRSERLAREKEKTASQQAVAEEKLRTQQLKTEEATARAEKAALRLAAAREKAAGAAHKESASVDSTLSNLKGYAARIEELTAAYQKYSNAKQQAASNAQGGLNMAAGLEAAQIQQAGAALFEAAGGWGAVAAAAKEAVEATIQFVQEGAEMAAQLETINLRLQYMSGSAADTASIMDTVKDVSKESGIGVLSLAEASQAVVRAGGDVQESLGRISELAVATGQSVQKTGGAYARALSGNSRALMALSRSYGISTDDLVAFGAHLTEQGKIAHSTQEDLEALKHALDSVIEQKYGGAGEAALGTVEGIQRGTEAAVNRLKTDIGEELLPLQQSYYETIYNTIRGFEEGYKMLEGWTSQHKTLVGLAVGLAKILQGTLITIPETFGKVKELVTREQAATNKAQKRTAENESALFLKLQLDAKNAGVALNDFNAQSAQKLLDAGVTYEQIAFALKESAEQLKAAEAGLKAGTVDEKTVEKLKEQKKQLEGVEKATKSVTVANEKNKGAEAKAAEDAKKAAKEAQKEAERQAREREEAAAAQAQDAIKRIQEDKTDKTDAGADRLQAVREEIAAYQRLLKVSQEIRDSAKARAAVEQAIKKAKKEEGQLERAAVVARATDEITRIEAERQDAVDKRTKTELQAVKDANAEYRKLLATDKEITNSTKARQKIEAQIAVNEKSRRKYENTEARLHAEEQINIIEKERAQTTAQSGREAVKAVTTALKAYQNLLTSDSKILSNAAARKKIEDQISKLTEERRKKEAEIIAMQRRSGESLMQSQRAYEAAQDKALDRELKMLEIRSGGTGTAAYQKREKEIDKVRLENLEKQHKAEQQRIKETGITERSRRMSAEERRDSVMRERQDLLESDERFFKERISLYERMKAKEKGGTPKWKEYQTQIEADQNELAKVAYEQQKLQIEAQRRSGELNDQQAKQSLELARKRYAQQQTAIREESEIAEAQRRQSEQQAAQARRTVTTETIAQAGESLNNLASGADGATVQLDAFTKIDLSGVVSVFETLRNSAQQAAEALTQIPHTIEKIAINVTASVKAPGSKSEEAQNMYNPPAMTE